MVRRRVGGIVLVADERSRIASAQREKRWFYRHNQAARESASTNCTQMLNRNSLSEVAPSGGRTIRRHLALRRRNRDNSVTIAGQDPIVASSQRSRCRPATDRPIRPRVRSQAAHVAGSATKRGPLF